MVDPPLELLLITEPTSRALVLSSTQTCLVLKHQHTTGINRRDEADDHADDAIMVEMLTYDDIDLTHANVINSRVYGCLGLIKLAQRMYLTHLLTLKAHFKAHPTTHADTFVALVTSSTSISSNQTSCKGYGVEPIERITNVEFYCLTSNMYDNMPVTSTTTMTNSQDSSPLYEHPCNGIKKILSNGMFYYSGSFDLSTRLEVRLQRAQQQQRQQANQSKLDQDDDDDDDDDDDVDDDDESTNDETQFDTRFMWNRFLVKPLLKFRSSLSNSRLKQIFDQQSFVVLCIQGYCGVYDVTIGQQQQPAVLSVISRLGSKRAGTRFNVRGVDDQGSVANFVETETTLRTTRTNVCFSFVQTRGSVPIFWEETLSTSLIVPQIQITRPIESSLPAFLKHFNDLINNYNQIHCINLLSSKDQEQLLTTSYTEHLKQAKQLNETIQNKVSMIEFDFHSNSKLIGIESVKHQLTSMISNVGQELGACIIQIDQDDHGQIVMGQQGVFRTNCKGKKKSNLSIHDFQQLTFIVILNHQDCLDRTNVVQDILSRFALENFILNTFQSNDQQHDSHGFNLNSTLWNAHRTLFAENGDALSKIYVGTGAINTSFTRSGKSSLAGFISNATKSVGRMYQSQFIDAGKQKSIDALLGNLTTSQKVRVFNPINELLHQQLQEQSSKYTTFEDVTLWVGTYNVNGKNPSSESLLPWLFPLSEIVPLTPSMVMSTDPKPRRLWEQQVLKTLQNKSKMEQSNYILLRSGQLVGTCLIVFVKKEFIDQVRNVEVGMKKTGLKGMAGNKGAVAIRLDFKQTSFCFITAHLAAGHSNVQERDQDYNTIEQGLKFQKGRTIKDHDNVIWAADTNYRISLPNEEVRTLSEQDDYAALLEADQKYDNYSDLYDTSEKQRIPAWTDRILYSGQHIDVNRYQRAELKTSDHRPVYAMFTSQIKSVNFELKQEIQKQLLSKIVSHSMNETLDDKLTRLIELNQEVSEPSNDKQAWWNEIGKNLISFSPHVSKITESNGVSGTVNVSDGSFKPIEPVSSNFVRDLNITNPFDSNYFKPSTPVVNDDNLTKSTSTQGRMTSLGVGLKRKPVPSMNVAQQNDVSLLDQQDDDDDDDHDSHHRLEKHWQVV
ncbi:Inositol-1,4,5-trisphosphate 5-phosphatase 1 [Microbotryomycetes sp. JL221]|nr:Inositol-1,4,5-trisphosphate 5-phosphatase 1 [Microbotryomycetes sp. JL221]